VGRGEREQQRVSTEWFVCVALGAWLAAEVGELDAGGVILPEIYREQTIESVIRASYSPMGMGAVKDAPVLGVVCFMLGRQSCALSLGFQ